MERVIKGKEEFRKAMEREKERRKRIAKAQEIKLAQIEKEKKLAAARERFVKMGGGINVGK